MNVAAELWAVAVQVGGGRIETHRVRGVDLVCKGDSLIVRCGGVEGFQGTSDDVNCSGDGHGGRVAGGGVVDVDAAVVEDAGGPLGHFVGEWEGDTKFLKDDRVGPEQHRSVGGLEEGQAEDRVACSIRGQADGDKGSLTIDLEWELVCDHGGDHR